MERARTRQSATSDEPPLLPGFPAEIATPASVGDTGPIPGDVASGWWVRKSANQTVDSFGMPAGFRHQLMHGRKIVRSGVGSDACRTFTAQADFLNNYGVKSQCVSYRA